MAEKNRFSRDETARSLRGIVLDTWDLLDEDDDLTEEEVARYSRRMEERLGELKRNVGR